MKRGSAHTFSMGSQPSEMRDNKPLLREATQCVRLRYNIPRKGKQRGNEQLGDLKNLLTEKEEIWTVSN